MVQEVEIGINAEKFTYLEEKSGLRMQLQILLRTMGTKIFKSLKL